MSVIKRRTRGKRLVRHITRLDAENNETLFAYAAFIDERTEYVLNELIYSILATDEEYVAWRLAHPESYVPQPSGRRRRAYRRSGHRHASTGVAIAGSQDTAATVN
jgi:hypothetical protein